MKNLLIYPSATTWITPRSEDVQLTTNNMLLIMPKPIANLEKVYFNLESDTKIRVAVTYTDTIGTAGSQENVLIPTEISTTQSDDGLLKVADMSKYFLEIAEYKTLKVRASVSDELAKSSTNYYTRYTPNIKLCTQREGWVSYPPIAISLQLAIANIQKNTQLYYKHITPITGDVSWYPITSIRFGTDISWQYMNWEFRVHFTPLGETTRLNTLKTLPEKVPFSIPFSQQQQIVSTVGLGRNMQSAADRTGAETRQVVRRIRNVSELRKLGSYSGVWRLTDMALTATNDRLIVTETWSKNWSVRSQFVGVNREFRSWNIQSDITQRNLLWQDYLLISNVSYSEEGELISDTAKDVLANFITGTEYSGNTEITTMWLMNNAGTRGAVLSCSAFGFGNSLVFSAKTKDNLSAGIRRAQIADGDADWQQCVAVYYCKDDGEFDGNAIKVSMGADITNMVPDVYPETYTEGSITYNALDTASTVLFSNKTFSVNKDPAEQINFTYQLHIVTNSPDLIIGTALAARNPLVTNNKTQLKYWELTKKLPQGAQTMSTYYGREVSDNVVTLQSNRRLVFSRRSGADVVGVCVTDQDNNILIARNTNALLLRTYYMNFTHNYKKIAGG